MKVLMFGWEFPPHISGGLGTACFGITESLVKSNIEVLFVIPKADAETRKNHLEIINASNVVIPIAADEVNRSVHPFTTTTRKSKKSVSKLTTLCISSALMPYTAPDVLGGSINLLKWNYQLPQPSVVREATKVGVRFQFSGTYGPSLMKEAEAFALTAVEIAKHREFDVIHAHDWLTYAAGMAAKKISGKPFVAHVHATEYDRAGENIDANIYKIEREGMEAADLVIAVSQWTKNIITTRYHIPAGKVRVVHNGILSHKKKRNIPLPSIGKKVVTFLGRITYQKGPEYFVEAAARVLQVYPDVHFVMAGSGDLLPKMIERVAHLRISSRFHFTGFLKSDLVDRIWSVTNVYVMPSVSEPFGISPLEAVQAGVPVIISNQSGVAEVMKHVIKIDFWNVEALADAICNLLKYQSLSKVVIRNSTQEIKYITWKKAAQKINTIYHELTVKNKETLSELVLSGAPAQAVGPV